MTHRRRFHRMLLNGCFIALGHAMGRGDPLWAGLTLTACLALTLSEEW